MLYLLYKQCKLNHYIVSFIPQNNFLRQNEQILLFSIYN